MKAQTSIFYTLLLQFCVSNAIKINFPQCINYHKTTTKKLTDYLGLKKMQTKKIHFTKNNDNIRK